MVKITTPPISPQVKPSHRTTSVAPGAPIGQDRQDLPQPEPLVERRKNQDRRSRSAARGPYDMRCGRDRRKNSQRGPSIEIDV